MALACDFLLIGAVWWFTAFVAGADINKGSVYTGPVGAAGAAYLVVGATLAFLSTGLTYAVHRWTAQGSKCRVRTWFMWMCSIGIFVVGTVADNVFVNAHLT